MVDHLVVDHKRDEVSRHPGLVDRGVNRDQTLDRVVAPKLYGLAR